MHVDTFIDDRGNDTSGSKYAAWFLLLHRLPSMMALEFSEWIDPFKLFCTYGGARYRVTGASRLGDVWLRTDHKKSSGYDRRVDIADCSDWSDKPC